MTPFAPFLTYGDDSFSAPSTLSWSSRHTSRLPYANLPLCDHHFSISRQLFVGINSRITLYTFTNNNPGRISSPSATEETAWMSSH
ncbi:Protein-arginine deiminase type-1 [Fusarium oxysporum f. sp. albedinis]|nr:Protein-arginine deiminase type-1 [Fusarium oxysporum f. sp. albedinis]